METTKEVTKPNTDVVLQMPSLDQLGELKGLKEVYKATASYRTQEQWFEYKEKPIRCFFLGVKELPNDKEDLVLSGIFAAEDGIFLAAQKVLVDAVRNLKPQTPIEITFKGKKSNKNSEGSTNIFEVIILGA
jgi:hypothetical protein